MIEEQGLLAFILLHFNLVFRPLDIKVMNKGFIAGHCPILMAVAYQLQTDSLWENCVFRHKQPIKQLSIFGIRSKKCYLLVTALHGV